MIASEESRHVVLLGDSIFDNAAYVPGGPDLVRQLTDRLPRSSRASLLAVDGAIVNGVARQLGGLPPDATHLVVSAGGNDALGASGVLEETVRSVAEAVGRFASLRDEFARGYNAMLDGVLARGLFLAFAWIPGMPEALGPTAAPRPWELVSELCVIIGLFGTGLRIDRLAKRSPWVPTLRLLVVAMPLTNPGRKTPDCDTLLPTILHRERV